VFSLNVWEYTHSCLRDRQAKMEMETEGDVIAEGNGDTSPIVNLVAREIQPDTTTDAAEMATTGNEALNCSNTML
jgi:hypothetical protein